MSHPWCTPDHSLESNCCWHPPVSEVTVDEEGRIWGYCSHCHDGAEFTKIEEEK